MKLGSRKSKEHVMARAGNETQVHRPTMLINDKSRACHLFVCVLMTQLSCTVYVHDTKMCTYANIICTYIHTQFTIISTILLILE